MVCLSLQSLFPHGLLVLYCLVTTECSLVRLVSKCTTNSGVGRCTGLPSSCLDMGGVVQDEIQLINSDRPKDYCPDDEVCCVLSTIPLTESCQTCGKKGGDRSTRRSNLERNLDKGEVPHKLRFLRQAQQDVEVDGDRMARIMNGDSALKNEWCWQVALLNLNGTVLGSGSLIDGRYIVTAAHKVIGRNTSNIIVLIGQYDFADPITSDGSESNVFYSKPMEIIIHERYNPETLDNNIAIIRIPMVSCNTANVCPVCLNDIGDSAIDAMSPLTNCYITGWGATVSRSTSTVLQEARVKILTMNDCFHRFAALGLNDVQLPKSAFCAEGIWNSVQNDANASKAMSTCSGDGGGPLVCEGPDGIWRLMGLIAMGLDECKRTRISAPTVFINVGLYSDWIHTIRRKTNDAVQIDFGPNNPQVNQVSITVQGNTDNRQPKSVDGSIYSRESLDQGRTMMRDNVPIIVKQGSLFGRNL